MRANNNILLQGDFAVSVNRDLDRWESYAISVIFFSTEFTKRPLLTNTAFLITAPVRAPLPRTKITYFVRQCIKLLCYMFNYDAYTKINDHYNDCLGKECQGCQRFTDETQMSKQISKSGRREPG